MPGGGRTWQRVWAVVGAAGVRARLRPLPYVVELGQSQDLCLLSSLLPSGHRCPLPTPNGVWGSPASFPWRRSPCTSWVFPPWGFGVSAGPSGALAPQGSCDPHPGVPVPPPPAFSSSLWHVGWEMHWGKQTPLPPTASASGFPALARQWDAQLFPPVSHGLAARAVPSTGFPSHPP